MNMGISDNIIASGSENFSRIDVKSSSEQTKDAAQKSKGIIGSIFAYFGFASEAASQQNSAQKKSWTESISNFFSSFFGGGSKTSSSGSYERGSFVESSPVKTLKAGVGVETMKNNLEKTSKLKDNAGVLSDKSNQFATNAHYVVFNLAKTVVDNPLRSISEKVETVKDLKGDGAQGLRFDVALKVERSYLATPKDRKWAQEIINNSNLTTEDKKWARIIDNSNLATPEDIIEALRI